jgi:hypothetical protein
MAVRPSSVRTKVVDSTSSSAKRASTSTPATTTPPRIAAADTSLLRGRPRDIWRLRTNSANAWLIHHQQDGDAS